MSYNNARDLFRQETEPEAEALERVRLNVRRQLGQSHPASRPGRAIVLVPLAAAAAVAALGLLVLRPPVPSVAPVVPTTLQTTLASDAPNTAVLTPMVSADFHGEGVVSGDPAAPRVEWRRGSLRLSVTPDAGVDLRVDTPEAQVHVIGTVFTVQSDRLGTRVSVERGRVAVTCSDQEVAAFISAGGSMSCWPTTPARLLNRATALVDQGAAPGDILETVERGLNTHPDDPLTAAQLRFLRIQTLGQLSRYAEAAAACRAFLSGEPPLHADAVRDYLQQLEEAGY